MKPRRTLILVLCFAASVLFAFSACSEGDDVGLCDACPEGQACSPAGVCAVICHDVDDCDICQDCVDGFCAPGADPCIECSEDGTCDGGLLCVDGLCVSCEPGVDDEACALAHGGDMYRCNPDGTCGLPPCEEGADCHEWGKVCESNYCWPCESDIDCDEAGYPDDFECIGGVCEQSLCEASTAPIAATADPALLCEGASTLSVTGGELGTGADWFWYSGSCGDAPEGTGDSISVSPSSDTTYYVRAEGDCGETECVNVTVTVGERSIPGIVSATHSAVCSNDATTTLTVSGHHGDVQWQASSDNSNWTNIPGAVGTEHVAEEITAPTYFRAKVTSGECEPAFSDSVLITVRAASTAPESATAEPDSLCRGGSSTLNVAGGSLGAGAVWRWERGSCGGEAVGTGRQITISPTETTEYFVRAVGDCNSTACVSVTVHVDQTTVAGTATASPVDFCPGVSSTLSLAGHTGSVQWQISADGTDWSDITDATGDTHDTGPLDVTTFFRAQVTSGLCAPEHTNAVEVSVKTLSQDPTGASASPSEICAGSGNSTHISIEGGSLGTGAAWYWYEGGACQGSSLHSGTNTSQPMNPTATTTYSVRGMGDCNQTACVSATVELKDPPVGGTAAVSECTMHQGQYINYWTVRVSLTGYSGSIQWRHSLDGVNWADVSGATSDDEIINVGSISRTNYFHAEVWTNEVCPSTLSNVVAIECP